MKNLTPENIGGLESLAKLLAEQCAAFAAQKPVAGLFDQSTTGEQVRPVNAEVIEQLQRRIADFGEKQDLQWLSSFASILIKENEAAVTGAQADIIADLKYNEIRGAVSSDEEARLVFWVVAKNLAGGENHPRFKALLAATDSKTPRACAKQWDSRAGRRLEGLFAGAVISGELGERIVAGDGNGGGTAHCPKGFATVRLSDGYETTLTFQIEECPHNNEFNDSCKWARAAWCAGERGGAASDALQFIDAADGGRGSTAIAKELAIDGAQIAQLIAQTSLSDRVNVFVDKMLAEAAAQEESEETARA